MLTAIRFTVSAPRTDQARIRAEYCILTTRWAMPPIAAPLSYVTIAAAYRRGLMRTCGRMLAGRASAPLVSAPILFGFALHCWSVNVLHLEPIGRAAGAVGGIL